MHTRLFRNNPITYFGLGFLDGWLLAESDQQLLQENNPIRRYFSYKMLTIFLSATPPAIALQTAEEKKMDCAMASCIGFTAGLMAHSFLKPLKLSLPACTV